MIMSTETANIQSSATTRSVPKGPSVGGDQREDSGGELASREVKAGGADVGVSPTVHDDVVPGVVVEAAQVGVGHQRP